MVYLQAKGWLAQSIYGKDQKPQPYLTSVTFAGCSALSLSAGVSIVLPSLFGAENRAFDSASHSWYMKES